MAANRAQDANTSAIKNNGEGGTAAGDSTLGARSMGAAPDLPQKPLLSVEDLGFAYGDHRVLSGITFDINPGEVVAILGPNGVGKSTMFRCILGFLRGYSGRILLSGDVAAGMAPKVMARRIAYIPQVSQPVFDFSVMELVLMGLASELGPMQSPTHEQELHALEVLDGVGIGHLAYSPSGSISGGEYQLALLARALLQNAPLIAMDEPTANLDYGNQYRIMKRVGELSAQGYSVVMSAHDPNQVLMHATRVLVINGGRLVADGAPREVMTPEVLSELYRIDVGRIDLPDGPALCYPAGE
jgi:iron complex transport system ATP-binding protein